MGKGFNISIVICSVICIVVLVLCVVFGVFSSKEYGQTIIDETNQTLEVFVGDNVENLTYYNKDYKTVYVPNVSKSSAISKPNLSSREYLEFDVWGGDNTIAQLYGRCKVSDYQVTCLRSTGKFDIARSASKKQLAFMQVNETISLTNVKHSTGIYDTALTGLNGIGTTAYKSEGNLKDFALWSETSYFRYAGDWYALKFKTGFEATMAYILKALLLTYADDIEKGETFAKQSRILLNSLCDIYTCANSYGHELTAVNRNIVANVIFTYSSKACNTEFVLNKGITPIDY